MFAKRLGILGASVAAMAAIYVPSAQAATNPYTPQGACSNDFGGSWSSTTDGHRTLLTTSNVKYGDAYLMYNSGTGKNCVVALKTAYVGTSTMMDAGILVQGSRSWVQQANSYKYYAAVQTYASGKCVQYDGWVQGTSGDWANGGRYTWGNCG
jgi:hypothetical protein